jgi:hypothetical protein
MLKKPNQEYTDPHITKNPITAAYPAGNGFFDGLEAIAMKWIRWKRADSKNDNQT